MLVKWPWVSLPAAAAHRLRFTEANASARVREVRAWFAERQRERFTWWVGDSATPRDLGERLEDLGAKPWDEEPLIATMLVTEPPPPVAGVEVQPVDTYERFVQAQEVSWRASELSEGEIASRREHLEQRWRARQADETTFLALVDGQPVASGTMLACPFAGFLSGAATLPEARGRGAFRALVRARWEEAVRRGTPALVVGAGAMSRPILERIGFQAVSETRVFVDRSSRS